MSVSKEQLDGVIQCPICREMYCDPRSLPCIHTFCLACIRKHNEEQGRGKLLCPVCRKECELPENGVRGLPRNAFLNQLIQMVKVAALELIPIQEPDTPLPKRTESSRITRKLQGFTNADAKQFVKKILHCIQSDDLRRAKLLMENLNDEDTALVVKTYTDHGLSLLFHAVQFNRLSFVEHFLGDCSADTEERCPYVEVATGITYVVTPLWLAAIKNRLDIVQCLLKHGAQVNAQTEWHSTVVRSACCVSNIDSDVVDVVRCLVENGADVTIPCIRGFTCLHVASSSSSSATLCQFLLEKGASVNATTVNGWTPLHCAVDSGCLDVVKLLVDHGADLNIRNEDGDDAVQLAVVRNRHELVTFLLTRIDVDENRKSDLNLLFAASYFYQNDVDQCMKHRKSFLPQQDSTVGSTTAPSRFTDDPIAMREMAVQANMTYERILGPIHESTIFSTEFLANIYAEAGDHRKAIEVGIQAIKKCRANTRQFRPALYATTLARVCQILLGCGADSSSAQSVVVFGDVRDVMRTTVDEFVDTLEKPLYLIEWPAMLSLMKLSVLIVKLFCDLDPESKTVDEVNEFKALTRSLVQLQPRAADGSTLLHIALDPSIDGFGEGLYSDLPDVAVIEFLRECGATILCVDDKANTPLDNIRLSKSMPLELKQRLRSVLSQRLVDVKSGTNGESEVSDGACQPEPA